MFYSIIFLIDLHFHGVPEANQLGSPRANREQLFFICKLGPPLSKFIYIFATTHANDHFAMLARVRDNNICVCQCEKIY